MVPSADKVNMSPEESTVYVETLAAFVIHTVVNNNENIHYYYLFSISIYYYSL